MDSVLAAFIILLLVLFAGFSLTNAVVSSQEVLASSWQQMQERMDEQAQTHLLAVDARTFDQGARLRLTLENAGSTRMSDFHEWDVIVQYVDAAGNARIHWLPFDPLVAPDGEWLLHTVTLPTGHAENYEPGIVNPGEHMQLDLYLPAAVAAGEPGQVMVATAHGVATTFPFLRNLPPVLRANLPLRIAEASSSVIASDRLETVDDDNSADQLTYTITQPPTQGELSLPDTFTQADVNAGLLIYMHTGTEADSFGFTVSDGQDTIGPFTYSIALSQPPQVIANVGVSGTANTPIVITASLLAAVDADDLAAGLRFSVVVPPTQGYLSPGTTFTQADIDAGLLTYTGGASDSFQFTVTDGESTVGTYTFMITVIP